MRTTSTQQLSRLTRVLPLLSVAVFSIPVASSRAFAADTSPVSQPAAKSTSPDPPPAQEVGSFVRVENALAALGSEIRGSNADLKTQIDSLRPGWWEKTFPAFVGLFGTLVGAWVSWLAQRGQQRTAANISRASAAYEAVSKIMDFRSRQLNEFYSPMRFLLQQTGRVRRQMCDMLIKQPGGEKFFYKLEPNQKEHLWVRKDGSEEPFRLIAYMHEIAVNHGRLMPFVEEIVLIGDRLSILVRDKGGLARSENPELISALGEYLGHYSILKDAFTKAKADPALLKGLSYNVTYPRHLDDLLDNDAALLGAAISAWEVKSNSAANISVTTS